MVEDEDYFLVTLPKGSKIYRSIRIFDGKLWFKERLPSNSEAGGTWFASTFQHSKNIQGTHFLEYITVKDCRLLFVPSLVKFGVKDGYDFVKKKYMNFLDKGIEGYASCDECEIFLHNATIDKILRVEKMEFIDLTQYID